MDPEALEALEICAKVAALTPSCPTLCEFAAQLGTTCTHFRDHEAVTHLKEARRAATGALLRATSRREAQEALANGADPNAASPTASAIHRAVKYDFVDAMLEHPRFRSLEALNHRHRTPLQEAYFRQNRKNISALVNAGADVNVPSSCGCRLVHYMIETDAYDMVELFAFAGADLNARDCRGNTPLHVAIANSCFDCLDVLLTAHGVDLHATNRLGLTPLEYAVVLDDDAMVTTLVNADVVPGQRCFEFAAEVGAMGIFDILATRAPRAIDFRECARVAREHGHVVVARNIWEHVKS